MFRLGIFDEVLPLVFLSTHQNAAESVAGSMLPVSCVASAAIAPQTSSTTVGVAASAPAASPTTSKLHKGTSSMTQLGETGRENTGRWTCEEHVLFLKGLEMHGKGWKKIAKLIKTRTVVQIRTHAQKYFQKLAKAKKNGHHGDMLGMEGTRFGGKRVKFTGKRRGLVYGSYLVGAEATSAAISPALQSYMPGSWAGREEGEALSDKEEDAAIEKGLYRFLSPVVLDAAASNLDATAPEVLPPSTPGTGVHANGVVGADGETTEEDGSSGGDNVDVSETTDDADSSSGEPLPRLARVTNDMYERCSVPTWFMKGGDIEELLADAAAIDWCEDSGGDAVKAEERGASILNANIENSDQAQSHRNGEKVAVPNRVAAVRVAGNISADSSYITPGASQCVNHPPTTNTIDGKRSNMNSGQSLPTANGRNGAASGRCVTGRGQQQKKKQPKTQESGNHGKQQLVNKHSAPTGDMCQSKAGAGTIVLQGDINCFASLDPHHVELKEEHPHHELRLEELQQSGVDDGTFAHMDFLANDEAPVDHHAGHLHTISTHDDVHSHADHDVHMRNYDVFWKDTVPDGDHGLLLDDFDGGIEF